MEDLEAWYRDESRKMAQSIDKTLDRSLRYTSHLTIVTALLSQGAALMTGIDKLSMLAFTMQISIAIALIQIAGIIALFKYFGYWWSPFGIKRSIKKGYLWEINLHGSFKICQCVCDCISKMNIKKPIVLLASDHNIISPSICQSNDLIYLVLPLGLVKMSSVKPDIARAMIAHEFGHVLQNDSKLWGIAHAFALRFRDIFYIIAIAIVVIGIIGRSFEPVVIFMFALMIATGICNRILELRRKSEELADVAAIVYAGGHNIYAAINEYIENDGYSVVDSDPSSGVHPAKFWRLKMIEEFMNKRKN